jgi:hypothetical protein
MDPDPAPGDTKKHTDPDPASDPQTLLLSLKTLKPPYPGPPPAALNTLLPAGDANVSPLEDGQQEVRADLPDGSGRQGLRQGRQSSRRGSIGR